MLPFVGPPIVVHHSQYRPDHSSPRCTPGAFPRPRRESFNHTPALYPTAPPARHQVDWSRVLRYAAIAAVATATSQLVAAPLISAQDIVKASTSPVSFPSALARVAVAGTLFNQLPLHLVKRLPTKVLSTAIAEISNSQNSGQTPSRRRILVTAGFSTTVAMSLTYPVHAVYYAVRKGVQPFAYRNALATRMYSGVLPAVASVFVVAIADKALYNNLRSSLRRASSVLPPSLRPSPARADVLAPPSSASGVHAPRSADCAWDTLTLIVAAGASAAIAGAFAEPLRAVARNTAVAALSGARPVSARATAESIWRTGSGGVGVFWQGYRARALRYALAAPIAKLTSTRLKNE